MTNLTTAREALMAELLQDVDNLASRIEVVDQAISIKIEEATQTAIDRAFLSSKFHFEQMVQEQEHKLLDAGHYAAATIGNQMTTGTAQLITVNNSLERKMRAFVLLLAAFSLIAGLLGGFIGALIVR